MSRRIPFRDKGHQPFSQVIQSGEVADAQPLALHKAEPLFDLVHPRAMHRQKPTDKAGMSRQLGSHLFAFMHTRVIEDQTDATNGRWNLPIQLGEQGDELFLPLAHFRIFFLRLCTKILSENRCYKRNKKQRGEKEQ
jgi:hypothetical protein